MQFGLSVWSRHPAVAPGGDRRRVSVECAAWKMACCVQRSGASAVRLACSPAKTFGVWHLGCGGVLTFGGGGWVYYPLCEFSGCPFVRA